MRTIWDQTEYNHQTHRGQERTEIAGLRSDRAILTFLFLATFLTGCGSKQEIGAPEVPAVEVTEVVRRDVPIYTEWVAQLNGPNNAQITPRVQGYLLRQDYRDGFFVKKGQLLYEIDPTPFEAALAQAKAKVAVAVANLSNADTNVARDRPQ